MYVLYIFYLCQALLSGLGIELGTLQSQESQSQCLADMKTNSVFSRHGLVWSKNSNNIFGLACHLNRNLPHVGRPLQFAVVLQRQTRATRNAWKNEQTARVSF